MMANCVTCKARCENAGQHRVQTDCVSYIPKDYPNPKTNYDRIVSKTPEELAVWLAQQEYRRPRFDGWLPLCNHVMGSRTCHKDGCEKCWLDWLKQEATIIPAEGGE